MKKGAIVAVALLVLAGIGLFVFQNQPSTVQQGVENPASISRTAPTTASGCPPATVIADAKGNPSDAKTDGNTVYVVDPVGFYGPHFDACGTLVGADAKTFVALDRYYGKDATSVWVIGNPTDEGSPPVARIAGADPATFTLISDPQYNDPEGFNTMYTKDKNHVYIYGQTIAGADAPTFVVVDPPQAYCQNDSSHGDPNLTCHFDARDKYHSYFRGAVVQTQ
ncbi:MAG TPA: DKNYY domain-containing protein [Candidatus Paceibacterota bacterium]|nr:DKNYY domain-containing protein [Candidatus Paceibacterota bacterium]